MPSGRHKRRAGIRGGGVVVTWREKSGWQVEGIANYGPNVVSFLLTTGRRRWYIVGAYVPPNNTPTFTRVDQALDQASKVVEVVLLGDLKVRLQGPRDAREEELSTVVVYCSLEYMTSHFIPRGRYRG